MKLLKMIEALSTENVGLLYEIQDSVESRMDYMEDREPESDGEVHDVWEEKRDALEELKDQIEEDIETIDEMVNDLKEKFNDYQTTYGGLSRW